MARNNLVINIKTAACSYDSATVYCFWNQSLIWNYLNYFWRSLRSANCCHCFDCWNCYHYSDSHYYSDHLICYYSGLHCCYCHYESYCSDLHYYFYQSYFDSYLHCYFCYWNLKSYLHSVFFVRNWIDLKPIAHRNYSNSLSCCETRCLFDPNFQFVRSLFS